MVDLLFSVGRLLLAFFLVFLNGFFVAAEFALVRVRSTAVDRLVEEGRPGSTLLQGIMGDLDDYLAVTQLGITIASLGLGWIGEPAVAVLIRPILEPLLPESTLHLASFAIGFGFITFLHVAFGELAPKTIAIQRAERLALFVAAPMRFFYYLFVPGIIVFNGTANAFTRLIGIPPASETDETLQEEEILMVLTRSGRQGHVDMEEVEMVERVFDLDDITVREVMVPRPDVVSVSPTLSLPDLRSLIIEAGHTRYPIVDSDDSDQIIGFLDAKDVLRAGESDEVDPASVTAGDLARNLTVVPETTRINDLLYEFQSGGGQMAAVIDEWGAFDGIATVEDIVEQIVGDIRDQFDVAEREPSIDRRGEGTYVVDGSISISEANDVLDAAFPSEGFGTVGGLVLDRLGRAPAVGDSIEEDGYSLEVERVDGARISSVVLRTRAEEDGSDE